MQPWHKSLTTLEGSLRIPSVAVCPRSCYNYVNNVNFRAQ